MGPGRLASRLAVAGSCCAVVVTGLLMGAGTAGAVEQLPGQQYRPPPTYPVKPVASMPPATMPPATAQPTMLRPQSSTPVFPIGTQQPTRSDDGPGGQGRALLLFGGLVAAVAAALALVWRRGEHASAAAAASRGPVIVAPRVGASTMQRLLEVSRRLTDAAATGDVDRAVVREAVGVAHAEGAALIRRDAEELVVAAETEDGLMVPAALAEGVIRQVADTGQPLALVSATERAIRNLPVALLAVPLVGGGRVEAVLVVVRRESEPFMPAEREALMTMAPVAASALHTARQARAAVEESLIDPLTGVGNRRRFDNELAGALAGGAPAALCIVDLDHFKAVNDQHGHPAGDALLRAVAETMRETVRPGDSVYRVGGEEFAILLRSTSLAEATDVAERVRAALAGAQFDVAPGTTLQATASFGVAATTGVAAAVLIECADSAVYEAKRAGRNCVRSRGVPAPISQAG